MALNPPINEFGEPCRVQGENFIFQRKGIEFEVKVDGLGKMKGMFGGGASDKDTVGDMMSGQQFSEKDLQMAKNLAKGRPLPDKDAIRKKRKAEKQAKKANRKKKKQVFAFIILL